MCSSIDMTFYSKSIEYRRATSARGYRLLIQIRRRICEADKNNHAALALIEAVRLRHIS